MKVKISAGFTGVISTGSYENTRPSYAAEIETDIPDMLPEQTSEYIKKVQEQLQTVCYGNFKANEQQAIVERINKERKDIRFYGEFPSVTSILNWDADFFIPAHELQQYASQGNLIDLQCKHFIQSGVWAELKDVPGTWGDIVIVKQGSLALPLGGWNFPAFLEKHPLKEMAIGETVTSKKHKFAGTPDISKCVYQGKKTLADIKRTPDKVKHLKQCAAYILALEEMGESPFEQMMLIPINDKTAQGWSKPLISTEIKQYQEMFLKDREAFKKRFGV